MPYTTKADGDGINASFWNANVRDQVISTVVHAGIPAGTEGQFAYETDTDKLFGFDGATWVEILKFGASNTWTPNITQSATCTFTTTYSGYYKIGRIVICWGAFAITSAGTANNSVLVSTPVTAASSGTMLAGGAWVVDASVPSRYPAIPNLNSTGAFRMVDSTQATNNVYSGQTGAAFSAALASGDTVGISAVYESAS